MAMKRFLESGLSKPYNLKTAGQSEKFSLKKAGRLAIEYNLPEGKHYG